ncbi:hypothetical protein EB796_016531 [Bugula neritina]|uniref:Uncharacterized protein n=1 Tax=Bugula neritina TaxID=10212 RepID=A0A7J7JHS1_BUGNE|nr:hypothetical protein EB796_016531 [Bugula neritina]
MSWCSYHAVCRDNPEVDVFGSNLYNKFIKECLQNENCDFPHTSRQIPEDFDFNPQTALRCNSVLVGTGVYDPKIGKIEDQELDVYHHGHRDFESDKKLKVPSMYCSDVYDAVLSILEKEVGVFDFTNNNEKKDDSEYLS